MSKIPDPEKYDTLDEWVFATTNTTGIDANTVWEIATKASEGELPRNEGDGGKTVDVDANEHVTRAEYERFQKDVREVIESFIDFMVAYEMVSSNEDRKLEEIQRQVDGFEDDAKTFFTKLNRIIEDTN